MKRLVALVLAAIFLSACPDKPESGRVRVARNFPTPVSTAPADTEANADVVGVSDGDTITVRFLKSGKQERIRLATIDAPELGQHYGVPSKRSLSDMVFGKRVKIVEMDRDQYGRIVAEVFAGGRNINLDQVRKGFAWHYKKYQRQQTENMRRLYDAAEVAARRERIGLWRDQNPVPPWEWRNASRK